MKHRKNLTMTIFSSVDEENDAEHARLARMKPAQRLREFGEIQKRVWGRHWTHDRMIRKITVRKVDW